MPAQRRPARRGQIWNLIATWHRRSKSPANRIAAGRRTPGGARLSQFPDTLPSRRARQANRKKQQYGLAFGSPQARKYWSNATCVWPNPGAVIPSRIIAPPRFDKNKIANRTDIATSDRLFGNRSGKFTNGSTLPQHSLKSWLDSVEQRWSSSRDNTVVETQKSPA
jgi:hypothetical protein